MPLTFGDYFREAVENSTLTKAKLCRALEVSRPYLYSVFAGEKTLTPENQLLAAEILNLGTEERSLFFDLAAKERDEVPADIAQTLENEDYRRDIRRRYLYYTISFDSEENHDISDQDSKNKKRSSVKVPCCYQGGKQRISKEIVSAIYDFLGEVPANTHFYDICCGSGAFTIELINKGIKPENITMLDISSWGSFWKLIGEGRFSIQTLDTYLNAIPKDKRLIKEHMTLLAEKDALVDEEYKYILLQSCSFGGKQIWRDGTTWKNAFFRSYWEPTATSVRKSPANPMQPGPETLKKRIISLIDACKGVKCINEDINVLLQMQIPENSVIYIDPPYKGTTGYAYGFDLDNLLNELRSHTNVPIFVSESHPISEEAIKLTFGGAKGGISGNKKGKHEEWLSRV